MHILARGSSELKFTSEAEIMEVADETLGSEGGKERWLAYDGYLYFPGISD